MSFCFAGGFYFEKEEYLSAFQILLYHNGICPLFRFCYHNILFLPTAVDCDGRKNFYWCHFVRQAMLFFGRVLFREGVFVRFSDSAIIMEFVRFSDSDILIYSSFQQLLIVMAEKNFYWCHFVRRQSECDLSFIGTNYCIGNWSPSNQQGYCFVVLWCEWLFNLWSLIQRFGFDVKMYSEISLATLLSHALEKYANPSNTRSEL